MAELAATQHGVVAMWQLLQLGYSRWAVQRLVVRGYLHRLSRGVFAVGHKRLSVRGRWMAAMLACGPQAVLSHHAAAALWDLRNPPATIDVIAPVMPGRPVPSCPAPTPAGPHQDRCHLGHLAQPHHLGRGGNDESPARAVDAGGGRETEHPQLPVPERLPGS